MDFSIIPILASTFALGIVFGLAVDARARRRMQAELRDLQRQLEELNRQYDEIDEYVRQQPDPTRAGTMTPLPHWHRHRTPLIAALEGMTPQGQQTYIDNLAASRVLPPAPPNLFVRQDPTMSNLIQDIQKLAEAKPELRVFLTPLLTKKPLPDEPVLVEAQPPSETSDKPVNIFD